MKKIKKGGTHPQHLRGNIPYEKDKKRGGLTLEGYTI